MSAVSGPGVPPSDAAGAVPDEAVPHEAVPHEAVPHELVGADPRGGFDIVVDGRTLAAVPGQTIGAVLHAGGIRSWRTTRFGGRPRGLFCGIGVCFDCLITVNGAENLRACLIEARPRDEVTTSR